MTIRTGIKIGLTGVAIAVCIFVGVRMYTSQLGEQNLPYAYVNNAAGFSLRLPKGYTIDESYVYQELGPDKGISGIKFTIPAARAEGTNLSSDSYISVESLTNGRDCIASHFLGERSTDTIADGGLLYSYASSFGAAAGNRYEQKVYAVLGTVPCLAVRYYIHYGVIDNYPEGTVREFDRPSLLRELDSIRHTLVMIR